MPVLKTITKHWLQRTCPPAGLLVSNVKHLHLLERMTYSVRLQKEFEKENGVRKMVSLQTRLFLKSQICVGLLIVRWPCVQI